MQMRASSKGISTLFGTAIAVMILVASITVLTGYMRLFQMNAAETFKALDIQNDRLRESLKFDYYITYVNVTNTWNKDSLIRYVLTLSENGTVIECYEVNFIVPALSRRLFNLSEYGIPVGEKYLFVTALGNAFVLSSD